jgi:signal transduction histidine kinase
LFSSALLCALLGYSQIGHPFDRAARVYGPAIAITTFAAAALSYQRASQNAGESKGWRRIAAAETFVSVSLLGFAASTYNPALSRPILQATAALFVVGYLVVFPWAIWSLPWRKRHSAPGVHWLGSLTFVGSLVLTLYFLNAWSIQGAGLVGTALFVIYLRLVGTGGVILYLISEDPRRIRGVLGWFLVALVAGTFMLGMTYLLIARGYSAVVPLMALPIVTAALLACAAVSGAPVEPAQKSADQNLQRWWEALMGLPLLIAGAVLVIRGDEVVRVEVLMFVVLASLLALRQFLLMDQLSSAKETLERVNANLEESVRQRTASLEAMQAAAMRTEKANAVAVLGAGVVHDLNNELTTVQTSLDLISTARSHDGESRQWAAIARDSSRRAGALVSRLMTFARQKERPPEVFDLNSELTHVQGLLTMALRRNIRLRLELCATPVWVEASRTAIEQMIVNLVCNSRDAIEGDGEIVVILGREDYDSVSKAVIQVRDNGKGIAAEVVAHIFEPFFTTKEDGKGTGLGLPSVKATVETLGGDITVSSAAGRGTVFTLSIPALALDAENKPFPLAEPRLESK